LDSDFSCYKEMTIIRAAVHWRDWGIWQQRDLSGKLGVPISVTSGLSKLNTTTAYLGWGLKSSGRRARALASKHGGTCWLLEDGFLRSLEGASDSSYSLVVDDLGIYYDASCVSRLERLIPLPLSNVARDRITRVIDYWRQHRLSKYNAGRDPDPAIIPDRYVLVADQTLGDASIAAGSAGPESFQTMLSDALTRHPDCIIILKVHPEVVSGRKRGHFDLAALSANSRVKIVADDTHPAIWVARAIAVYVVTSQLGFEALLWSKPVHVYGMPFYAGWGLTNDLLPAPHRRSSVNIYQLAYAALIAYPRYFDPETGDSCEIEVLMEWLALQRQQRQRFPNNIIAYGFSKWKQRYVRDFLAGSTPMFTDSLSKPQLRSSPIVTWGHKHTDEFNKIDNPRSILRIEDGFLRSVGLGADLIRPISWVIDPVGIYYDSRRPSLLEQILSTWHFDDALRTRAQVLRGSIVSAGLTKYNLSRPDRWRRPSGANHVILVVGQVETDASIRYGSGLIQRNIHLLQAVRKDYPNAWLVYKPHPDVLAGLRQQGDGEAQALYWCNEIVGDTPYEILLDNIDEVHVLTSLAGFEALMRNIPVTTWGQPFYAGWGLTQDRSLSPEVTARRQRRLTLDELVAATLILYPTYVSRTTRRFCSPERAVHELLEWRSERPAPSKTRRLVARFFRKP